MKNEQTLQRVLGFLNSQALISFSSLDSSSCSCYAARYWIANSCEFLWSLRILIGVLRDPGAEINGLYKTLLSHSSFFFFFPFFLFLQEAREKVNICLFMFVFMTFYAEIWKYWCRSKHTLLERQTSVSTNKSRKKKYLISAWLCVVIPQQSEELWKEWVSNGALRWKFWFKEVWASHKWAVTDCDKQNITVRVCFLSSVCNSTNLKLGWSLSPALWNKVGNMDFSGFSEVQTERESGYSSC